MLLLRSNELPAGDKWLYEIKFDGYRAIAFKTGGKVHLRSRNDNDFSGRYPGIANALAPIPDETVIDGEVVVIPIQLECLAAGIDASERNVDVRMFRVEVRYRYPFERRMEVGSHAAHHVPGQSLQVETLAELGR